jgi:hypothetical protein
MFFLSWFTALGSGMGSECFSTLTLSPARHTSKQRLHTNQHFSHEQSTQMIKQHLCKSTVDDINSHSLQQRWPTYNIGYSRHTLKTSTPTNNQGILKSSGAGIWSSSQEQWVGKPATQVWSSAGTASIHLDVYPSALSLLWQRYCAILNPHLFIYLFTWIQSTAASIQTFL